MNDQMTDDTFNYGERREDGQFENHPTTDEGEFVQPVRENYVHDECGTVTKMPWRLAKSFARDPTFYDGTFCCGCGDYYPLKEFRWEANDQRLDVVGEGGD